MKGQRRLKKEYLRLLARLKSSSRKSITFRVVMRLLLEAFQAEGLCSHFNFVVYSTAEYDAGPGTLGAVCFGWPEVNDWDVNSLTYNLHVRDDVSIWYRNEKVALVDSTTSEGAFLQAFNFLTFYKNTPPEDDYDEEETV